MERPVFISDHKVEVQRADGVLVLESDRFFINTGSSPFIPPIQGIQGNPYVYVSETLLDMETLPERLVIIGGGYIGVEFASIYADFGVDVTIFAGRFGIFAERRYRDRRYGKTES